MKKTILMFAAAGLMLATPSCKKGANDPFMSLSSRKARVAGDWNVTGYDMTSRNDESNGNYQTNSSSLSGTTMTATYVDYDANSAVSTTTMTTTTLDKATFVFGKDGTFTREWNTTSVSVTTPLTGFTNTTTTISTSTATGNWSFIGKAKDAFKNKERMMMNTLTYSGTSQSTSVLVDDSGALPTTTSIGDLNAWTDNYASGENSETWNIDQLKGKEMIVKMDEANSGSWSFTPSGGSTTSTTNDVYTSDLTITLTPQ